MHNTIILCCSVNILDKNRSLRYGTFTYYGWTRSPGFGPCTRGVINHTTGVIVCQTSNSSNADGSMGFKRFIDF